MGNESSNSYRTLYSYLLGYSLLDYFHEQIGADGEKVIDFYNRFRRDDDLNMVDLIKFYADFAQTEDPFINGSHIIRCLITVEALAKTAENLSSSQSLDSYIDYVCYLYDLFNVAKSQIDEILDRKRYYEPFRLSASHVLHARPRKAYAVEKLPTLHSSPTLLHPRGDVALHPWYLYPLKRFITFFNFLYFLLT